MIFQQTYLSPYTLSLLRFGVRQFDDFSLVFGIDQLTSHVGKFFGVCLQHFGFDFQDGDSTVKFTLHCPYGCILSSKNLPSGTSEGFKINVQ